MIERVATLVPSLAERAEQVEKTRTIHPDTVQEFWDTQLWSIMKPKRYGGLELDYGMLVDVPDYIARGCASTSWIYANLVIHDWMLAMWPSEAQDVVWKNNPRALMASSLIPNAGRATPVAGGYRIAGRWPYCSGIDVSDWMMMAAMTQDDQSQRPIWFVVPRFEFEEIDTWHVSGLIGTGSRDVRCEDVFVPEHRTVAADDLKGGPTPGAALNPGPLYQVPLMAMFPYILSGVALGRERVSTYNASKLSEHTQTQMKVAEAGILIHAARLLAHDNIREAERIAESGRQPTVEEKVRWRRDGAFAAQNCVKSIQILQSAIGAAGNYLSHPFQRRFRDMHAAAGQIQINFDINGAEFGRVELGLEPVNKSI